MKATQSQGWEEEQQGRLFPFKTPRCFERHGKVESAGEPVPRRGEDGQQMHLQATGERKALNSCAAADSCGCSCAGGAEPRPPRLRPP